MTNNHGPSRRADAATQRGSLRPGLSISASLCLILACGLIMAAGWGIRGSFGHSRGAMMPGAMLGLTLAACSMRSDWWQRSAILGFLAMIGWGFGGVSSYGLLIGYSMGGTYTNSLYGLSSLFLVGSLYCGIGAGFLALGLTERRRLLESAVIPMVAIYATWLLLEFSGATAWGHARFAKPSSDSLQTTWLYDVLWLPSLAALLYGAVFAIGPAKYREVGRLVFLLSAGWWLATAVLIGLLGLRINPGRSDAWAGCLGVQLALIVFLWRRNNRAGLMLTSYGMLSGGLGFALGDFIQALGRAKWGPIGRFPALQEFGYWTVMEQFFGLCMGVGVGLAAVRLIRGRLARPDDDSDSPWLNGFSVFCLLGLLFAINSRTNIAAWLKAETMPELAMGYSSVGILWVCRVLALAWLLFAIVRVIRGKLDCLPPSAMGRSQTLCVLVTGMVLSLYLMLPGLPLPTVLMFFVALGIGLAIVISLPKQELEVEAAGVQVAADAPAWNLGWKHWGLWCLTPSALLLLARGVMHLDIPVKQIRFPVPLPDGRPIN
ncbi:MAG: hypothetical protein IT422_10625 [Pirellulaceae bacterium]|nr:hypothetical protein [Pirellulaceae bacterium]